MDKNTTLQPCDKCFKIVTPEEYLINIYGVLLCPDCWDDYLCADFGKAEYIKSIVDGECQLGEFDADFLGLAALQWNKHKSEFDLSATEVQRIETQARILGIL